MLTLDEQWVRDMTRNGITPVYHVTMDMGPLAYLTVNDYTQGSAEEFTISWIENGSPGSVTYTEGTHFVAAASNAQTAANIGALFVSPVMLFPPFIAGVKGAQIVFAPTTPNVTSITITSTLDAAWSATPEGVLASYVLCSGDRALQNSAINIVADVKINASELDIVTRQVTIGDAELTIVDDGWIRELFDRSFPRGRRVQVRVVAQDHGLASITTQAPLLGTWAINDWRVETGAVVIELVDPFSLVAEQKVFGSFLQMHPLAVIRRVYTNTRFSAQFFDDASIESTSYPDISHWATSRHSYYPKTPLPWLDPGFDGARLNNAIESDQDASEVIAEMELLLNGSMMPDESGLRTFRRYDPDATIVDALRGDDGVFEHISTTEDQVTKVTVLGARSGSVGLPDNSRVTLYTWIDRTAAFLAGPVGTRIDTGKVVESDWIGTPAWLVDSALLAEIESTASPPFDIILDVAPLAGFSGLRQSVNPVKDPNGFSLISGPGQRALDQIDPTRPLFLLLTDGVNREVFRVDQPPVFLWDLVSGGGSVSSGPTQDSVPFYSVGNPPNWVEPGYGNPESLAYFVRRVRLTVAAREQHGTLRRAWNAGVGHSIVRAYDVTIAADLAPRIGKRCAYGVPRMKALLDPRRFALQLGDFVSVETDQYLNHGKRSGSDQGVVWEVTSKQPKFTEDAMGVEIILRKVRDEVTPVFNNVYETPPTAIVDPVTTDYLVNNLTDNYPIVTGAGAPVSRN